MIRRIVQILASISLLLLLFIQPAYAATYDKVAVIFGMADYVGTANDLNGPINDIIGMRRTLQQSGFKVNAYMDYSGAEVLSAIDQAIATLPSDGTLLFHFSGHAADGGYLFCADESFISIASLESRLSAHPGTKIVLIDACYSGDYIAKNITRSIETDTVTVNTPESFNESVLTTFGQNDAKTRNLAQGGYKVLTACAGDQLSYEVRFAMADSSFASANYVDSGVNQYWLGAFTRYFNDAYGLHSNPPNSVMLADDNNDNVISLHEMYVFTSTSAQSFQDVQVYPENDAYVLITQSNISDVTGDGSVDLLDITAAAQNYHTATVTFDLNQDGIVNLFDLMIIGQSYTD